MGPAPLRHRKRAVNREGVTKLAILAITAVPLTVVLLTRYRFRLEPAWRMDPIPFGFFLALALGIGWLMGRRR